MALPACFCSQGTYCHLHLKEIPFGGPEVVGTAAAPLNVLQLQNLGGISGLRGQFVYMHTD